MRLATLGYATLFLTGLLTVPVPAAAQKDTETVNRTVAFPDKGTLKIDNFSGRVTITATGGKDVVVKAIRRAERDRLDHIKLDIHVDGSMVVIDANKRDSSWREQNDNVVDTELDIEVPASATLRVGSFSSPIDIRGIAGDQTLRTFSGNITVTGAKGAVNLDSFSGDLDLDVTGAGASPEVRAKTFSGDMRLRMAADARGEVSFSGHRGAFDSVGNHGVTFDTFSGHIRIVK